MKLREAGLSTRQIAEKVGCTHTTVRRILDASGTNVPVAQPTTIVGNGGTAQTGSVSAALRLVAYRNLVGKHPAQNVQDHSGKNGVGEAQVTAMLDGVPGIGLAKVRDQLENLKTSGHYTRIMQEVSDRVEREAKAR